MNEELTTEETIQLFDVVVTNVSAQFELWITITFAVIIASYVASHRLSRSLKYLLAALYTSVSVLLFLVMLASGDLVARLGGGAALSDWAEFRRGMIQSLRGFVWILGSIATLIFIFRDHQDSEQADRTRESE